jgi:hypothetical protein
MAVYVLRLSSSSSLLHERKSVIVPHLRAYSLSAAVRKLILKIFVLLSVNFAPPLQFVCVSAFDGMMQLVGVSTPQTCHKVPRGRHLI